MCVPPNDAPKYFDADDTPDADVMIKYWCAEILMSFQPMAAFDFEGKIIYLLRWWWCGRRCFSTPPFSRDYADIVKMRVWNISAEILMWNDWWWLRFWLIVAFMGRRWFRWCKYEGTPPSWPMPSAADADDEADDDDYVYVICTDYRGWWNDDDDYQTFSADGRGLRV